MPIFLGAHLDRAVCLLVGRKALAERRDGELGFKSERWDAERLAQHGIEVEVVDDVIHIHPNVHGLIVSIGPRRPWGPRVRRSTTWVHHHAVPVV